MIRPTLFLLGAVAASMAAGVLVGCRGAPSEDPPLLPERNMYDQERFEPQGFNEFFADGRNMRKPPEGTMSREYYDHNRLDDTEYATGLDANARYLLTVPQAALDGYQGGDLNAKRDAMLKRGHQRYDIYCAPCHSKIGDGKGTVTTVLGDDGKTLVMRPGGFPTLPDFTDPRLRQIPDGQLYNTISHGLGNMPAYEKQIPIADRWAIVSYVRALQLSQMVARNSSPGGQK
jgi:mono/diheme cytochrome c family protein